MTLDLLKTLEDRSLVFVGGKGGVGKTTIAAMLAVALAARGERVRLVSTDPAHNLGHLFEREVGAGPAPLAENLEGYEIDPARAVADHLAQTAGFLRQIMPRESWPEIDAHLARSAHAPGMAEAALLDRLCDLSEDLGREADRLIVDTAPTGHTLALLSLPETMSAYTEGLLKNRVEADRFAAKARMLSGGAPEPDRDARIRGVLLRRRERLAALRDRIRDPARAAFVVALTPERMPVLETLALMEALGEAGVSVPAMVVNRVRSGAELDARLAPLRAACPDVPLLTLPDAGEPTGRDDLAALLARASTA